MRPTNKLESVANAVISRGGGRATAHALLAASAAALPTVHALQQPSGNDGSPASHSFASSASSGGGGTSTTTAPHVLAVGATTPAVCVLVGALVGAFDGSFVGRADGRAEVGADVVGAEGAIVEAVGDAVGLADGDALGAWVDTRDFVGFFVAVVGKPLSLASIKICSSSSNM